MDLEIITIIESLYGIDSGKGAIQWNAEEELETERDVTTEPREC